MQWVDIGNCWTVFKLQHNPVANYIYYRSSFELFGTPYCMCETLLLYSPYKQCHQWLVWRSWWVRLVKMPWRDGSRWQKNPRGFKSRMFSWWSLAYPRNEGVRVTATLRKYIECWVVESFLEIRYWNENFTQWDKHKSTIYWRNWIGKHGSTKQNIHCRCIYRDISWAAARRKTS